MKKFLNSFCLYRLAAYLIFVIIISLCIIAAILAKYAAGNQHSFNSRIAAFGIELQTGSSGSIAVDCSGPPYSSDYSFSLVSTGEAAVSYGIDVVFGVNIPSWITVKLDGNTGVKHGNTVTFENAGEFEAGNSTNNHTLTFLADPLTKNGESIFRGVAVRVNAVQKD